jgi:hypothetical protein
VTVGFCFASCSKDCKCTTTALGISITETVSKDELKSEYGIDKCSDMNMEIEYEGMEMKMKCK